MSRYAQCVRRDQHWVECDTVGAQVHSNVERIAFVVSCTLPMWKKNGVSRFWEKLHKHVVDVTMMLCCMWPECRP